MFLSSRLLLRRADKTSGRDDGLPLVLLLLSLLPVAVVLRHAGTSCASAREGVLCEDDKRFVSPMDTYWLHDTEFNFHVAHCVLYLEPGLTASLLSQLIVERILDKTNDEGKRIFRRSVPLKC
ncbi:hypothetical protein HPB51_002073 [Rhipicephalus microplus]|uniref:Uncharacterized protein n=1 Tax=Rhipicephalus microplus TaxID=6941 RepID=A0A9J6E5K0_RHIMP|nr:hypothetical protein HPB51_002073 [Rhipicephalus microplus]